MHLDVNNDNELVSGTQKRQKIIAAAAIRSELIRYFRNYQNR